MMRRLLRYCFIASLVAFAIFLTVGGLVVWSALDDLPDVEVLKDYQPAQSTLVYDRSGALIGRFFDENRTVISIKKLPRYIPLAFVAAEDGDFFEHKGIDYFGVLRAIGQEIKFRTVGGSRVGGSTITQQTARAMLLTTRQTYVRKMKEMVLAQRIEKTLSKDQILHLYLNQIYFGNGAHGIEEAALTYFGKHAQELELFEAAALAAVPKSPNRINPFGDTERLKSRQAYVLEQMVKRAIIRESDAQKAKDALLFSAISDKKSAPAAQYFLDAVKNDLKTRVGEEVIRLGGMKVQTTLDLAMQRHAETSMKEGLLEIDKRFGYRGPLFRPKDDDNKRLLKDLETFRKRAFAEQAPKKVWNLAHIKSSAKDFSVGLKNTGLIALKNNLVIGARVANITDHDALIDLGSTKIPMPMSSLLWARQFSEGAKKPLPKKVSDVLKIGDIILVKLNDVNNKMWASLEQEPVINGGLVSLDVETGGVLAMVGGYDYSKSPFNRVLQSKRQPGSGVKPPIYAYAIDLGLATASTLITDAPRAFHDPGTNQFWQPRNHTGKFLGDITLGRCLRSSINICTITLLEMIGLDRFLAFAKDIGLSTPQTPYPRNLTIALGSAESYPINVANAMRILPNKGIYAPYSLISNYRLASGEQKSLPRAEERQVIKPQSAFIVTNMLKDVIGRRDHEIYLKNIQSEVAGKTGTTNNARSVWFLGYSPKVLTLVFVGYDDNRSLGDEWGRTISKPICLKYMNKIYAHQEALKFPEPEGIEWHLVETLMPGKMEESEGEDIQKTLMIEEAFFAGSYVENPANKRQGLESLEQSAFAP